MGELITGNLHTLEALRDPSRRPLLPMDRTQTDPGKPRTTIARLALVSSRKTLCWSLLARHTILSVSCRKTHELVGLFSTTHHKSISAVHGGRRYLPQCSAVRCLGMWCELQDAHEEGKPCFISQDTPMSISPVNDCVAPSFADTHAVLSSTIESNTWLQHLLSFTQRFL